MLSSELGVHIFLHWCSQSSNCPAILLLYLQIPQKKHMLNLPNKLSTLWELFFEPCCCFCLAPREDAPCTACSWGSGFFDIWAVGAQGVWFPRNRKQLPLWAWIPWLTPGLSGPSHIFVKHCCQIVGALWLITWQWSAAVPLEQGIYLQVTLGSTQSCLVCLSGASCPFCTFSILSSGCVSSLALFKCYFCTSATLQLQPCGEIPTVAGDTVAHAGDDGLHITHVLQWVWGPLRKEVSRTKGWFLEELLDLLGSVKRCWDSRSLELILFNWFLFIQWKPLGIEVSFPNLNLLTDLWITVDTCQFW